MDTNKLLSIHAALAVERMLTDTDRDLIDAALQLIPIAVEENRATAVAYALDAEPGDEETWKAAFKNEELAGERAHVFASKIERAPARSIGGLIAKALLAYYCHGGDFDEEEYRGGVTDMSAVAAVIHDLFAIAETRATTTSAPTG
jgi:hypothetical protein